ncbi:hypothetical protein [Alkalihalobacterium bogoriense]|uniref:hypothetical protein n=1 Tax=Alkalihalobacterium bogoriense TaxID=246272 RepID=UPI000683D748|nr:hypothetical protein [Alkalihalobacterium bogoriense]
MNKEQFILLVSIGSYVTAFLYLFSVFIEQQWLTLTYSFIAFFLVLCAIPIVGKINQMIASLLVLIGFFIYFTEGISVNEIMIGFGANINLLTLFLFVPFIGVFLSSAGYLNKIKHLLETRNENHPYRLSSLLTATMGSVLNLGSMAIVHRIAEGSFRSFDRSKLLLVVLRSFAFCMFWSPYFVNVGLVLSLFHVEWKMIGALGFSLGLVYLLISAFFFYHIRIPQDEGIITEPTTLKGNQSPSIRPVMFFFIGLFGCSFLFDALSDVNMLTIVSILALAYPLLWAITTKRLRLFVQDSVQSMKTSFARLKNEIVIFISAGFFGGALSYTTIGTQISQFIFELSFGSILAMSFLVILFAIALAMIGIHPVVIVIGIGSSLSPDVFGVSAEYMALLLLVAWTLATQLSPFSGSILMTAGLANRSPFLFMKQNILFVFTNVIVLPFILYLFLVLHLV